MTLPFSLSILEESYLYSRRPQLVSLKYKKEIPAKDNGTKDPTRWEMMVQT